MNSRLTGHYIIGILSLDHSEGNGSIFEIKRILRFLAVRSQVLLGIRRNTRIPFHKGGAVGQYHS